MRTLYKGEKMLSVYNIHKFRNNLKDNENFRIYFDECKKKNRHYFYDEGEV